MAKIYNNGIVTTAGFQFNANLPLDDRLVVETYEDLASIPCYEGMIVYVKNDAKHYKYSNNSWGILVDIEIAHEFDSESQKAQSGKAVAQAIEAAGNTLVESLSPVAFSGSFDDILFNWLETEIVFDGGSAGSDAPIAEVGRTPLA